MEITPTTCLIVLGLVGSLVLPGASSSATFLQDQKNFYFPPVVDPTIGLSPPPVDPTIGSSPPRVTLTPPVVPSPPIGYYNTPPPTYGSTPPVHHAPPHGGGGGGHHHRRSPPANCGNPPPHKPPRHVDPSPSPPTGGYHYNPPPSGGGGGSGSGRTPNVPSTPPVVVLPPITPGIPFPSPPFDPNSPPINGGTCNFWRNHPGMIWGIFGWWGTTVGSAFGVSNLPGTGAHLNLVQALSNTRADGIGALYREGTASLLNSMVNKNFPFTTSHVKESFVAAIGSNKAAAAQARVFKLANEGHMKLIKV